MEAAISPRDCGGATPVCGGVGAGVVLRLGGTVAYPKERPLGFSHGILHGALMPMALPSLILGKDVDIFAANQSGRPYKIGYICGINLCGLVFFGTAFAKPGAKSPLRETSGQGAVRDSRGCGERERPGG